MAVTSLMSLAEMRAFVRTHLDVDSEELSDDLVDRFIQDASNRIESYSKTWAFRQVEYTITTVDGVQPYTVFADTGNVAGISLPLTDVVEIRGQDWSLKPADHRRMRRVYTQATTATAETPYYWSRWGTEIYLWPEPSAATALDLLGYRKIRDWVGLNESPDFPYEFDELIAWWALNRGYAFLDDPEMASFYREEFYTELKERARPHINSEEASFVVAGGDKWGTAPWRMERTLGPLIYPFE